MPYVNLPPGNSSLAFEDGSRAVASRPGGRVWLSDKQAKAVDSMSGNGDAGLVTGRFRSYGGSRNGRWCAACRRLWNAWNRECPKCGAATEPE
jgi:hypothetical protein